MDRIKELQTNEATLITKADKGKGTVILYNPPYTAEMKT